VKEKEVWIDGGITRGTDVLKALCLGAKGVGLGRAFLYGNGAWGEDGVRRVVESMPFISLQSDQSDSNKHSVLRGEIETGMQLLGVTKISDLKPELIRYVDRDLPPIRSR
jgi:L-lactate dehydrogenase (cytochrome)